MSQLSEIEEILYNTSKVPKKLSSEEEIKNKRKERIVATVFLGGVTGLSLLFGFSSTLASVKKNNPDIYEKNNIMIHRDAGVRLAVRALCWGSIYATLFCSTVTYGIWKISGANNFQEFRLKAQNFLPKITKTVSD